MPRFLALLLVVTLPVLPILAAPAAAAELGADTFDGPIVVVYPHLLDEWAPLAGVFRSVLGWGMPVVVIAQEYRGDAQKAPVIPDFPNDELQVVAISGKAFGDDWRDQLAVIAKEAGTRLLSPDELASASSDDAGSLTALRFDPRAGLFIQELENFNYVDKTSLAFRAGGNHRVYTVMGTPADFGMHSGAETVGGTVLEGAADMSATAKEQAD